MKNRPFPAVDAGRIEIVPISEEKGEIIKVTNEIGENIPASKLIEDFFYVPLESIEESLFAYCNQIEVFEDKIFVFDRTGTEKLFFQKNRHKAQRKAKFYINKCRSASCMQSGWKRTPA